MKKIKVIGVGAVDVISYQVYKRSYSLLNALL